MAAPAPIPHELPVYDLASAETRQLPREYEWRAKGSVRPGDILIIFPPNCPALESGFKRVRGWGDLDPHAGAVTCRDRRSRAASQSICVSSAPRECLHRLPLMASSNGGSPSPTPLPSEGGDLAFADFGWPLAAR